MARPIVVVGAGAAGLATALAAAPAEVLLLSVGADGRGSASELAQGGIAAALAADDTPAAHRHDTLVAGGQHNDPAAVAWLTAQAPGVIDWLVDCGMAFDRDAGGGLVLGREGGHGVARIAHAGGDASGAELVRSLAARVRRAGHVQRRGGVEVDALLLRGGRVVGVRARGRDGAPEVIEAGAVVLATGGLGALYQRTSNPPAAMGSGLALAAAAGARLRDLEFVQFHPTALAVGGTRLPLLTEALRGAGARLVDGNGRALMAGVHPQGDLAPRDIVARTVWQAARERRAPRLDTTPIEGDWQRRFPTVLAACRAHGLDPRCETLPISPAAHFHMGGVATDLDGRTSLPGLHAVGEVACNGVHGANRLASNSLLEGVACGRRLGQRLAWPAPVCPADGVHRWVERGRGLCAQDLASLRRNLWQAAGPVREARAMERTAAALGGLAEGGWQARLGLALLHAAQSRSASLGAHFVHSGARAA